MRHRVKGKALGRNTKQRQALFKGMLRSLFEEGAIETTETKAKVIRRLADKIITKAKPQTLNARRTLERFFGSKQVVNRIVDGVVPAVNDRQSGYTTLTRLGRRRGDDASMVQLALVGQPIDKPVEVKEPVKKKAATDKKAPAKKSAVKPATKKVAKSADDKKAKTTKKTK